MVRVGRSAGCLIAGLALVAGVAACGGGDDGGNGSPFTGQSSSENGSGGGSGGGSSSDSGSQPSVAPPITFDSTPGPSAILLHNEYTSGVRLKVIDTALVGQVGDQPASPNSHLFAAYVVFKSPQEDRGVNGVRLHDLHLRFTVTAGTCSQYETVGSKCGFDANLGSTADIDSAPAAAEEWASSSEWTSSSLPYDLGQGEEEVGVVAWPVPDSLKFTAAEVCDGATNTDDEATCMPIKSPERTF